MVKDDFDRFRKEMDITIKSFIPVYKKSLEQVKGNLRNNGEDKYVSWMRERGEVVIQIEARKKFAKQMRSRILDILNRYFPD